MAKGLAAWMMSTLGTTGGIVPFLQSGMGYMTSFMAMLMGWLFASWPVVMLKMSDQPVWVALSRMASFVLFRTE